jgi:hypothetical protein
MCFSWVRKFPLVYGDQTMLILGGAIVGFIADDSEILSAYIFWV